MIKIRITHSLIAIVFVFLVSNLSNHTNAAQGTDEAPENALRQRLTVRTHDTQTERVQLQHRQPSPYSWKAYALGSLIVTSGLTYVSIIFFDYMQPLPCMPIDSLVYGGGSGSGGVGVSW